MIRYETLQPYFKERILELLHKDTLDSHRVRAHNALSILYELKDLIKGWTEHRIQRFETVKFCLDEATDLLKSDTCLDYVFYGRDLFADELTTYGNTEGKTSEKSNRMIKIIDRCASHNESKYLAAIFAQLEQQLFKEGTFEDENLVPTLKSLDGLIIALACELIRRKYAKAYLYPYFKNVFSGNRNLRSTFDAIRRKFLSAKERDYTVILKLRLPDSGIDRIGVFSRDISDEYDIPGRFENFSKGQKSNVFYQYGCQALDDVSAVKKAKAELASLLDVLHLGMSRLSPEIDKNALVISSSPKGENFSLRKTDFVLDGNYSDDAGIYSRFKQHIDAIRNNQHIDTGAKNRLDSALRHLRVGSASQEIEQQFINYWIALEFIFSSGETGESTYSRLKENLTNILACCYAKRNLLDLNQALINAGMIASGTYYWKLGDMDGFIAGQTSILMRYKLLKMKSRLFVNHDKRKKFIKNHEKNLLRHLSRIYRMRNELIHEAAIKQDIEGVTSNLRYYLVFLLNQLIVYFADAGKGKDVSMDDFFLYYEMWKRRIEENWELDTLLTIPLEMDLLK